MSTTASAHATPTYRSRNTSSTSLNTVASADTSRSRPSRLNTLARLKLQASPRIGREASPLENARKEFTMSMCSDATTTCDTLPASPSELTLAHSVSSIERRPGREESRSFVRSLAHRSSRMFLKRSTSKTSFHSTLTDHTGSDSRRTSIESIARPSSKHSTTSSRFRFYQDTAPPPLPAARPQISSPFHFQHVAHTAPVQAINALRQVSPTALQTEFSAMQAGQSPSDELKHVDCVHLRPTTSDASSRPSQRRPTLKSTQSTESFKRQSKSFSQPFLQNPTPPPRRSSRKRPNKPLNVKSPQMTSLDSFTLPELVLTGGGSSSSSNSSSSNARPKTAPSPKSPLRVATSAATTPLGLTGIVHAVTTPDDTACVLISETATPLEDVPEEEVSFFATHARQVSQASTLASTQYSIISDEPTPGRMLRSGSDPVLPETAALAEEIPERTSRRISNIGLPERSWDDDIDYCYDHALEADENELQSPDIDSPVSEVDEMVFMRDRQRQSPAATTTGKDASLLPLHLRRGAAQAPLQNTTLRAPTAMDAPLDSAGNVMFTLSPSMIIPREYSLDETFHESNHRRQSSNKSLRASQLPMFTPSVSDLSRTYSSPRSSVTYSNSSKRNSGFAAESNSSLSTISIPDLVSSGKHPNRKSIGARSTRSSLYSQATGGAEPLPIPPATCAESSPAVSSKQEAVEALLADKKEVDDILSEMPIPPSRPQPLRARAKSESASRALANINTDVKPSVAAHSRSASSAVAGSAAASATTTKSKATYSLFPPLDRIGAASSAKA